MKTKSSNYQKYLNSPQWEVKRQEVLSMARGRCWRCEKIGGRLQVHHRTYKRITRENLGDLVAVCRKCHLKIHGLWKSWTGAKKTMTVEQEDRAMREIIERSMIPVIAEERPEVIVPRQQKTFVPLIMRPVDLTPRRVPKK